MSRGISPSSITYEVNSCEGSPYRSNVAERDILSQLKVQVFEADQNKRNYNCLLSKFKKLQEEFAKVCEIKKQNEFALKQFEEDKRNKDIKS